MNCNTQILELYLSQKFLSRDLLDQLGTHLVFNIVSKNLPLCSDARCVNNKPPWKHLLCSCLWEHFWTWLEKYKLISVRLYLNPRWTNVYYTLISGSYSSCPTERLKYLLHENNLVHGPILKSTKRVYLYQLKKLKQGRPCGILNNVPLGKPLNTVNASSDSLRPLRHRFVGSMCCLLLLINFCTFVDYNDVILATMNGKLLSCIEKWTPLEALLVDQIRNAALAGNKFDSTKQYFTYLLLDPSATKKISNYRLNETDLCSSWESFLKSVFYIGKGKNSRPLDHLLDAMKHDKSSPSEKVLYSCSSFDAIEWTPQWYCLKLTSCTSHVQPSCLWTVESKFM